MLYGVACPFVERWLATRPRMGRSSVGGPALPSGTTGRHDGAVTIQTRLASARTDGGYERWQRRTRVPLAILAGLFLAVLLTELLWRHRPATVGLTLRLLDYGIWASFAVEYLTRLYLVQNRKRFVLTHPLDLLIVIVPTLRPLRLLRLVRLAAVLGVLGRHSRGANHLRVAVAVTLTALVLLVVAAAAMFDAERDAPGATIHTFGDALWWAASTVTTVGYGDKVPVTTAGRLVAVALMVVGIAVLGVVTAAVAAWFVGQLQTVQQAEDRETATLTDVLGELRALREANAGLSLQLRGLEARLSEQTTKR